MAAYLVIFAEIEDAAAFMKYAKAAAALTEKMGGEYIVRGGTVQTLEGDWPDAQKMVISRWPTRAAALAFWNSADYAKIKTLRLSTAKVNVKLFEGIDE